MRACNSGGCAPWSNPVSYTVPPPPGSVPAVPSNLKDYPSNDTWPTHALKWTLNSPNATSIVLTYQDDQTPTWNAITLPVTSQYVLRSQFERYHAYNIYVQACNDVGCSAPSSGLVLQICRQCSGGKAR